MAVVHEEKIGNTTIRIHDDYCRDKTPEQVQAILDRIAYLVQGELVAAMEKELEEGRNDREPSKEELNDAG